MLDNQQLPDAKQLTDYQRALYKTWVTDIHAHKMGEKTTVVLIKLKNGFEIVGTSACVDPKNYIPELGEHYALIDAVNQLDAFVGFYRQMNMAEASCAKHPE